MILRLYYAALALALFLTTTVGADQTRAPFGAPVYDKLPLWTQAAPPAPRAPLGEIPPLAEDPRGYLDAAGDVFASGAFGQMLSPLGEEGYPPGATRTCRGC